MENCVLCGAQNNVLKRYVSCGSETEWGCLDQGTFSEVATKDDIVVWHVGLCHSCLSQGYHQHILKSIQDNLKGSFTMFAGIVAGIAACFWAHGVETGSFTLGPGSSKIIWAILITAGLIFGFISVLSLPQYLNRFFSYKRKQMVFETQGQIDNDEIGGAFESASRKILETAQNNKPVDAVKVYNINNFELPVLVDKPATVKGHEKGTFKKSSQQRVIVGSGNTPEEAVSYAGGWIDIILNKRKEKGIKPPEEVHSKWPKGLVDNFNKFLYLSIIIVGFLAASIILKKMGDDDISFLLRIPLSLVVTLAALLYWVVSASDYKYMGKLFGPKTVASWRPRFWIISFACWALIVVGFYVGFAIQP